MLKKPCFNLTKHKLEYESVKEFSSSILEVPLSEKSILFFDVSRETEIKPDEPLSVKPNNLLKTGEKFLPFKDKPSKYITSGVTGKISSINKFQSDYGKKYISITVNKEKEEIVCDKFSKKSKEPSLANASEFLQCIPGGISENILSNTEEIKTLFVCGTDNDLFSVANQYIVSSKIEALKKGIEILKNITGINNIILVVNKYLEQTALNAEIKTEVINSEYPSSLPKLIVKELLNIELPPDKSFIDIGVDFISAEAVAAIAQAYNTGKVPVDKLITFVKKDGSKLLAKARIGTPIKNLCAACDTAIDNNDRLIIGGPMTGSAIYTDDYPILNKTDAVIVQAADNISLTSDYPCINCGTCVAACPARLSVNMIVRYLEAGLYEVADDEYDLSACIECGLCSYVCISKIPIFQYIKLGKYELAKIKAKAAEEVDD
ncbi:MAG: 4Fe-4S dicluster domain-containing protein [Deltaproteobacteria bacterium]|nr:4Fe-4S dicluster domain-containing protein [Deltaproteobacteria bacterium]